MDQIRTRLKHVRGDIANAARGQPQRAGPPTLIAVSKTRSVAEIDAAFVAGVTDFGENYTQEALPKIQQLTDLDISWHFIGAIQSNKTRDIAQLFDWVHTIDRLKIARRLAEARPRELAPLNLLLQVNIDNEPQKAGAAPEALAELAAAVSPLPRVRLRGLMAIPRPPENPANPVPETPADPVPEEPADPGLPFRRLRDLFEQLKPLVGTDWDTLSMGMSGDFESAIAEGATMVRIGTAIFGPRRS